VTPLDDFIIGRLRGRRRLNSQWTLAFACTPRIQRWKRAYPPGPSPVVSSCGRTGVAFGSISLCRDGQEQANWIGV